MNFGIGFGAFANGLAQGIRQGRELNADIKQAEADDVRNKAMDEAQKTRDAEVQAKTAALMGLGPQAPGQDTGTPGVSATQPIDVSNPQATPLPAQGLPAQAAPANVAAPVPTAAPATPQVPPQATGAGFAAVNPANQPQPAALPAPAAAPAPTPATPTAPNAGQGAATPPDIAPRMAAVGLPASTAPEIKPALGEADARAQAEKTVPTVLEFFQKTGVPRVAETYIRQGDPVKAAAWEKWSEDQTTQKNVRTWAQAYRAVEMGDWQTAGDKITELYGHYQDGQSVVGKPELVKDKDGKVTGFNVNIKNDASGETRSQFIATNDMATLGLTALSPPQLFEATYKAKLAKDAAVAAAQNEVGKSRLRVAEGIAIENARQPNRVALQDNKNKAEIEQINERADAQGRNAGKAAQAKLDANVQTLKNAGYSDDVINALLPELMGASSYKKATSPEEAKRLAMSDRMKNDPTFSRKSLEERQKIIEEDMGLIYGGVKSPAKTTASSAKTPASSPAAVATKGVPMWDTKTNQLVYR